MPMEISESKRKQRKYTLVGLALTGAVYVVLFLAIHRPWDPPPSPTEPDVIRTSPEPKVQDPEIEQVNEVVIMLKDDVLDRIIAGDIPEPDDAFESWTSVSRQGGYIDDLPPEPTRGAIGISPIDIDHIVDATSAKAGDFIESFFGPDDVGPDKSDIRGVGTRISGHTAIAILDLPGASNESAWTADDLEAIADFITGNTSLQIRLAARAISFVGSSASFGTWLEDARRRGFAPPGRISSQEPEIDALKALGDAMPLAADGEYEKYRRRIRTLVAEYLRQKFDARLDPLSDDWVAAIEKSSITPLREYQKRYLRAGQEALQAAWHRRQPTGQEARGLYVMLRQFEMMQLPILFCEPRGVPTGLHPETLRMLHTYVHNGGFLYFTNTADIQRARAIRGLISAIVDDGESNREAEELLARLMADDQEVTGYTFRPPEPSIAHPWTFFPMILPRTTDVTLTVYNRRGAAVFTETLEQVDAGAYLQKFDHYRWHAVDNAGNPLESGPYVYRIEAGLARKTGPIYVSKLRRLPNGKHGIFSSSFNITEVPSTVRVKADELPYGEEGVFGVSIDGRLAVCYTEGYREKDALNLADVFAREASLQWMTNVVMHALAERSLAR
ncbi:MAG: hypothetical protein GF331_26380 [Chitinivibrionales bacterium]|nr:hypothetical protein [Chitinivibrionales bacterium]